MSEPPTLTAQGRRTCGATPRELHLGRELLARRRLWVVAPAFCSLLRSEWKSPTRLVHPTLYLPESEEQGRSGQSQGAHRPQEE